MPWGNPEREFNPWMAIGSMPVVSSLLLHVVYGLVVGRVCRASMVFVLLQEKTAENASAPREDQAAASA